MSFIWRSVPSRTSSHLGIPLKSVLMACALAYGCLQPALPSVASAISYRIAKQTSQSPNIATMEQQLLRQVNHQRQRYGLPALRRNPRLSQVARTYSQQMAAYNIYGHIGPSGETHRQRVEAAGLRASLIGENLMKVDYNRHPVALSVNGWMNSAGHRKNILLPQMTETGVGIWQRGSTYYVTQLYIEPKR
ncbi:MAG: CAP domain-containing protein [Cyanobacteria bacterium P01_A01_bin.17]